MWTQHIALSVTILLSWIWIYSPWSAYTIQALSVIVIAYLLISRLRRHSHAGVSLFATHSDVLLLTSSILLIVWFTGMSQSPLLFLIYVLIFGVSLLYSPSAVVTVAIGTLLFLLPDMIEKQSLIGYIEGVALLCLAPLAYFFGRAFKEKEDAEEQAVLLHDADKLRADTIAQDVAQVLTHEKDRLSTRDVDALNEVLEQTELMRK